MTPPGPDQGPAPRRPASRAPVPDHVVEAARTGDRHAWGEIVKRYNALVLSIFVGYTIPRPRAVELCQELWLRLFLKARDGLLKVLRMPGFAVREARFRALDERRGTRHDTEPIEMVPGLASSAPTAEEQAARRSELSAARRMLSALPTRQRQVLVARVVHGKTTAQVAEDLEISTARTKQTLCAARARMRTIRAMPHGVREAFLRVVADRQSSAEVTGALEISPTELSQRLETARRCIQQGSPS